MFPSILRHTCSKSIPWDTDLTKDYQVFANARPIQTTAIQQPYKTSHEKTAGNFFFNTPANTTISTAEREFIGITIWLFNSSPWKDPPIFKFGKPSISMGHLYHGYVSHNQMVHVLHLAVPTEFQSNSMASDSERSKR